MWQKIKNYFWHLPNSIFWQLIYGFPQKSLILIGVTGTDGKTSVCTLINKILINAGLRSTAITTISSPGLHTTSPEPKVFFKILKEYHQQGITHVVCETTSHALDQFRYFGCHYKVGIITNISHEHLDYHHTMTNYVIAKSKLFTSSEIKILNSDCEYFDQLKKIIGSKIITYSIKNPSNYQAKSIRLTDKSVSFKVNNDNYQSDTPYYYQIYNLLAGIATAIALKIPQNQLIDSLKHFPDTNGRRETININSKITTIVDFAHTPNALNVTLSSVKKFTKGRIICIFGATGGRDKSKRPIMGQVVSKLADIAIVTSDDTRMEKIEDINNQIISGFDPHRLKNKKFTYFNIPNRQDAFNQAVQIARTGDTIIACGKGHETSILIGKTEYPWSEVEAFKTAFRQIQNV